MTPSFLRLRPNLLRWNVLSMADSPRITGRLSAILAGPPTPAQHALGHRLAVGGGLLGIAVVGGLSLFRPTLMMPLHAEPAKTVFRTVSIPMNDPRWIKQIAPNVALQLTGVTEERVLSAQERKHYSESGTNTGTQPWWLPSGFRFAHALPSTHLMPQMSARMRQDRPILLVLGLQGTFDDETSVIALGPLSRSTMWDGTVPLHEALSQFQSEAIVARNQHQAPFSFGVATGPWAFGAYYSEFHSSKYPASLLKPVHGQNGNWTFSALFNRPVIAEDGGYHFVVKDRSQGYQTRIIALDVDGKTYTPKTLRTVAGDGLETWTARFDSKVLPLNRIKELCLEARPYKTVTFDNVELYPKGPAQP